LSFQPVPWQDQESKNAQASRQYHGQTEDVSPAKRRGQEAAEYQPRAEPDPARGSVDAQRSRPVLGHEVGADDSNCGRDGHCRSDALQRPEGCQLDE